MGELEELKEYCRNHKKIFCYGAGVYGRTICAYLNGDDIDIDCFIVSNEVEGERKVLEVPVISLSQLKDKYEDGVGIIIGVAECHKNELINNLKTIDIIDYYCIKNESIPLMEETGNFTRKYNSDNNITVFCFHRVANLPLDTWKITETTELFEKQLIFFKEKYKILRAEEDWSIANDKRSAVITFDDGYEDAYTNILPLLEKYEIPATFFICTENIDTDREFWWDDLERVIFYARPEITELKFKDLVLNISSSEQKEKACYQIHSYLKKMDYRDRRIELELLEKKLGSNIKRDYCNSLTSQQLRMLAKSELVTIGGHTVTHSCLAEESVEHQEWEIVQSKKQIEEIIQKPIEVFSYPFGQRDDFSAITVEIAKRAGYKKIFTAYSGMASVSSVNGYIPRINIGKERDFNNGIRKLGLYENIYGDSVI